VRDGLVDRVFVMSYAPSVQKVLDQLVGFAGTLGATDRVVPGIAVYNSPASTAAAKIKAARTLGYPLIALYSYDSLFTRPAYWSALRAYLDVGVSLHP
jgi:hypothetical protein